MHLNPDNLCYNCFREREGQDRCYSFLDQAGQPIPLDVGSSYINVVASSAEVFWE